MVPSSVIIEVNRCTSACVRGRSALFYRVSVTLVNGVLMKANSSAATAKRKTRCPEIFAIVGEIPLIFGQGCSN